MSQRTLTRRQMIGAATAPTLLAAAQRPPERQPRIAAIASIYHKFAHAQHICDRFLIGYGWNGAHHKPAIDLVSLWVDQVKPNDLSRSRAKEFPVMKIYPTIAEALTLGTGELAVDGVLLIGEHGDYPDNEKGQKLYPRYEFFREIVKVFEASGRGVPLFNDKHLSWNWEWAREMYDTSRRIGFPFMAGSSLPVTWRTPSIDMPYGAPVREALCVFGGWIDGGDIHAFETLQCMSERRKGGESGVRSVRAYRGENFWKALGEGAWSRELMEAAMCRSHELKPSREGFNNDFPSLDAMKRMSKNPYAYVVEHTDGLRSAIVALGGVVGDFCFAARIDGRKEPLSTQMYLPMPPAHTTLANFFSPQVNNVEKMFLTGKPSYPVERTLLTTGLTAAGVESLYQREKPILTPHLEKVAYAAPRESTFWRT